MEKKDGGPAYPVVYPCAHAWMSLRDKLAMEAMKEVASFKPIPLNGCSSEDQHANQFIEQAAWRAEWAYAMADAMILARSTP